MTAYEMRISDWSSDVCSSDLIEAERVIALHQKKAPVQTIDIAQELGIKVFKVNDWPDNVSAMIRKDAERGGESGLAIYVNGSHPRELGSAAVREGVWTYVEI